WATSLLIIIYMLIIAGNGQERAEFSHHVGGEKSLGASRGQGRAIVLCTISPALSRKKDTKKFIPILIYRKIVEELEAGGTGIGIIFLGSNYVEYFYRIFSGIYYLSLVGMLHKNFDNLCHCVNPTDMDADIEAFDSKGMPHLLQFLYPARMEKWAT
ncbi:hypothetical protein ACJX0J_041960, partial [Zea mays]